MDENLEIESSRLAKSWMRHDERMLGDYLVSDVEDPRINIQSILSRHFLIEALFGARFVALMDHELRFGAVMNWLSKLMKKPDAVDSLPAILDGLQRGADNAEGQLIPHFVRQTFVALPADANGIGIPHYIRETLEAPARESDSLILASETISTFQRIWREVLEMEKPRGLEVLEPACGSANDYRFLDSYGLARLVNYSGFDLCEKNVGNARRMFPSARFKVGNVFEIDTPEKSFDLCFVHDLFEHLSIQALEVAVKEISRVTREGICAGFFSMHEGEDHLVRPVEDYHWNSLSLARTNALFERNGFKPQAVHIGTFLKWRFGCDETHNENAYTFIAISQHG